MSLVKLRQIEKGDILWFADGSTIATANWDLGGFRLTNIGDPINPQDAATKAYVDARVQGLTIKSAVKVATTANITLSGTQTIDGVALSAGDRILVKNQTTGSENGIYVVAASAWVRATDAVNGVMSANDFCFVSQGATLHDTGWVLTTDNPIVVGTTSLTYTQFSGAGSYTNGTGIALTGNVFSLNAGIDLLTDVVITSATTGNVLRYNGTNWVNAVLSYTDLSNRPTFGTLVTNATTGQTASPGESFNNTITLHKVSKTGSYNDLLNLPSIPTVGSLDTTNTTSLSPSASEAFTGVIDLHQISKTGKFGDLAEVSLISPALKKVLRYNGTNWTDAFLDYGDLTGTPTIPTIGSLVTTASTAQSTSSGEAFSGSITLHKISKTGTYTDLINIPVLNTSNTTTQTYNASETISGIINLHKVAKTGTYSDLLGKPTIPSAPGTLNSTLTTAQATNASEALSGSVSLHKIAKTGTFSDLIGVLLTSPVNGNILSFNGSNWVNSTPASSTVTLTGAVTGTGQTGTTITTTITDSSISSKWDRFRFTSLTGSAPTLSGVDFTNMMSNNNTLQVFLNGVLQDIYVGVPSVPSDYDGYINVGTLGLNKIQFTTALVSTDILIIMGIF